jgi:hypothetical protein
MASKKFSQFNNGGNFLSTDETVGLRGGVNTRFALNFQNPTIIGTGDPNGFQAGTAGKDTYFDSVAKHYWNCITTGTTSTAVWDNISIDLESINIDVSTPVQMLSNRIYYARLSSPAANSIMPIAPNLSDIVIIHANAAAGINISKGTGLITISGTSVSSSFFLPFGSTIILRCFATPSGGQWRAEGIIGSVTIDGSIVQNAIGNIQLNKASNLSDVASASISLNNIGGQRATIIGTGDPNGVVAGEAGLDTYFDSAAQSYWGCITTGTSSTAVWQENVSTTLESIIIAVATPVQFLSNKIYFASLSSPVATGIMPVNPNIGDVVIVRSNGAAGINVNRGTSLVTIGTNSVSSFFFVPFQTTIKLRCFSVTSGGQWSAETISNYVLVDGVTIQNAINNVQLNKTNNLSDVADPVTSLSNIGGAPLNSIKYPQIAYINSFTGDDSSPTGCLTNPFLTYEAAVVYLSLFSPSATNRCAIYATGEFNFVDMFLYPFIDIFPLGNALFTGGLLQNDSSWDSIPLPFIDIGSIRINFSNIKNNFNFEQGAIQHYIGTDFTGCLEFNSTGTGTGVNENLLFIDCLDKLNQISYNFNEVSIEVRNCQAKTISSSNSGSTSISARCIDILNQGAGLDFVINDLGSITDFFAIGCNPSSVNITSSTVRYHPDSSSYTVTPIFSGGANISNVYLSSISDGEVADVNFTPVNFTPVSTVQYSSRTTTGFLNGIDNKLGLSLPILFSDKEGFSDVLINAGANSELLFPHVTINNLSGFNSSTSTFTAPFDGYYKIQYDLHHDGTAGVATNTYWLDSSIRVNSAFENSDYGSCKNPLVANLVEMTGNNSGFISILLTLGDTINVRAINNGNIPITIKHSSLEIKYLGQ